MKLTDFEALEIAGRGASGKVIRAKSRKTGQLYAMKAIEKGSIDANSQREQLLNEILIMKSLKHQNIIELCTTFEDHKYVYLILELADEVQMS